MNKRTFLKTGAIMGLGSLLHLTSKSYGSTNEAPTWNADMDEEQYWLELRKQYDLKPDYINLENGFYNIMPQEILDKYIAHIKEVNVHGAYYMRTMQVENKQKATIELAKLLGCPADEMIITRNTTESLDMVIAGLDWQKGEEALMVEQDYGAMLDMFKQTSKRHGMVPKILSMPMNPTSDEEIVRLYEQNITDKTKLIMICHMINITGHILPVRKICDMAHKHNVPVLVDGAHTIAHINFKISDLHCDFFGSSLHKWLCVPIGAGMLHVSKKYIPKIWPLLAEHDKPDNDINRLNHTGTHPVATDLTIIDAIQFYHKIGADRKENRLRALQNYWVNQVRVLSNIELYTPTDPQRSCAIATVGIKGMKPSVLAERLLKEHRIYTVAIDNAQVHGCRITPNVYTTFTELDTFVYALKVLST